MTKSSQKGAASLILLSLLLVVLAVGLFFLFHAGSKMSKSDTAATTVTGSLFPQASSTDSETASPTAKPTKKPTPFPTQTPTTADSHCDNKYTSVATGTYTSELAQANSIAEAAHALQDFTTNYSVTTAIRSITPSSFINLYTTFSTLDESDLSRLKTYGNLFICEWAKYPPAWVTASSLKSVMFVKNLSVTKQLRAATPDSDGKAVYYDIGYSGDEYQREVLHHEYYHLIEFVNYGDFYYKDPTWASYNDPSFHYIGSGNDAYTGNFVYQQHPESGFVTSYARYGLEEDKAETYAYLFESEDYHLLQTWLPSDPLLTKKVTYLKNFIKNKVSSMDDAFFQKINQ